jgi:hypothetical protein
LTRIPNKATLETFKKTDAGIKLNTYEILEEFAKKKIRCRPGEIAYELR